MVNSENKSTFKAFLLDPNSKMKTHGNYNRIITTDYKTADGLMDVIQASETPMIFNLDQVVASGSAPEYIVIMHNSGIKQLMGIALQNEGEMIELFGHERGSFTGATECRLGKFELANHGTLFLDEIGDMPLDLQVKLLRALQEREIERVGGKVTIKVDVRIIAATNRNLQKEVDEGKFRSDLYYRLNVFPITLPSLREHKDDIPVLASHFINKYAKNNGRKAIQISSNAMKELLAYNWPGNVMELEHLIERSILMSTGSTIREMHLPKLTATKRNLIWKISIPKPTKRTNEIILYKSLIAVMVKFSVLAARRKSWI